MSLWMSDHLTAISWIRSSVSAETAWQKRTPEVIEMIRARRDVARHHPYAEKVARGRSGSEQWRTELRGRSFQWCAEKKELVM